MAKSSASAFPMFGASGADMSQSSTISAVTSVRKQDNVGILVDWSGSSPSGTLLIQVSNDYNPDTGVAGTWHNLDFGSTISITGNSGQHEITINQLPFSNIRAEYDKISGTGTIFASLSIKSLSGGAS